MMCTLIYAMMLLGVVMGNGDTDSKWCCSKYNQYEGQAILTSTYVNHTQLAFTISYVYNLAMDFSKKRFALAALTNVDNQQVVETEVILDYIHDWGCQIDYSENRCHLVNPRLFMDMMKARCLPHEAKFALGTKVGTGSQAIDADLWVWSGRTASGWYGNDGNVLVENRTCIPIAKYDQNKFLDTLYQTDNWEFVNITQGVDPAAFRPPSWCKSCERSSLPGLQVNLEQQPQPQDHQGQGFQFHELLTPFKK